MIPQRSRTATCRIPGCELRERDKHKTRGCPIGSKGCPFLARKLLRLSTGGGWSLHDGSLSGFSSLILRNQVGEPSRPNEILLLLGGSEGNGFGSYEIYAVAMPGKSTPFETSQTDLADQIKANTFFFESLSELMSSRGFLSFPIPPSLLYSSGERNVLVSAGSLVEEQ